MGTPLLSAPLPPVCGGRATAHAVDAEAVVRAIENGVTSGAESSDARGPPPGRPDGARSADDGRDLAMRLTEAACAWVWVVVFWQSLMGGIGRRGRRGVGGRQRLCVSPRGRQPQGRPGGLRPPLHIYG